ncbi:Methyltransferase domain-containing protein [Actinopolymorpha cephalotaxi]|uniref:Methyltransferase domain-containing protein n=1 Tax=Actinopolymorpha cephalotaxi TaxID=504797 RepID=A0A1I2XRL1_9ACTN|nr:class I SAM-dependent methyltransferase [Actinopolymorpha cephalotaxi]NYH87147.1 SAM-dependent methyltransferase [Actinopolymorpha cephalotaxi]SFH16042.1 Methyltransferase domain-containing protein [Actinopolymorpha cephalotaxi]
MGARPKRWQRRTGRLVRHPLFARVYARLAPAMDRAGLAGRRRQLLAGLTGRVVEIGSGSGLNFAHYPADVAGVLAVEPEPSLLRYAVRNAAHAPVPVALVDGTAEHVPGADGAFDAAVVCLVLCSVPDQRAALAELHRVIRPGGQLRFLEHVRADGRDLRGLRGLQRVLDATVWPALAGGCHLSRDTLAGIEAAGFAVNRVERFRFPDGPLPSPSSPHILGTATRTGGPR